MKHTPRPSQSEFQFNPIGPNPSGLCMCGCGRLAPIATHDNRRTGLVKGQPARYMKGHSGQFPSGDGPNPRGFCECGCGQLAPIAKRTNTKLGHIQGLPVRFAVGHNARLNPARSIEEHFWKNVDKRGPDECWEWQGPCDPNGYGIVHTRRRPRKAHRVSYEIHNGPFPQKLKVCHECDNPPCCNPKHLWLGTQADNMKDMYAKGRAAKPNPPSIPGEKSPLAHFTNAQVRQMREQYQQGNITIRVMAQQHGVSPMGMWQILNRVTYRDA